MESVAGYLWKSSLQEDGNPRRAGKLFPPQRKGVRTDPSSQASSTTHRAQTWSSSHLRFSLQTSTTHLENLPSSTFYPIPSHRIQNTHNFQLSAVTVAVAIPSLSRFDLVLNPEDTFCPPLLIIVVFLVYFHSIFPRRCAPRDLSLPRHDSLSLVSHIPSAHD